MMSKRNLNLLCVRSVIITLCSEQERPLLQGREESRKTVEAGQGHSSSWTRSRVTSFICCAKVTLHHTHSGTSRTKGTNALQLLQFNSLQLLIGSQALYLLIFEHGEIISEQNSSASKDKKSKCFCEGEWSCMPRSHCCGIMWTLNLSGQLTPDQTAACRDPD